MTHQPISLNEIDFSQPDGEFIYKGQTYQLKEYSNYYFFRNKKHTNHEFIYTFKYSFHSYPIKDVFHKNSSPQKITQTIQKNDYLIQRCVQYKKALFSFGSGYDQYYSPKYNQWIFLWCFKCNATYISLDEVFKKPYAFFVEQAVSVYEQELPLIEDEEKFVSFTEETTKPIEFIRGSEAELEKLTKFAAFTLPELSSLFERYSRFIVIYKSETDYENGGVIEATDWDYNNSIICTEESKHGGCKEIFSKQAEQLFNLIFQYNCFSGFDWEIGVEKPKYNDSFPMPENIEVEVESPSQHERMEAALELERWLEGKLPEEEIRAYFEW